eukprot:CFRG2957T1
MFVDRRSSALNNHFAQSTGSSFIVHHKSTQKAPKADPRSHPCRRHSITCYCGHPDVREHFTSTLLSQSRNLRVALAIMECIATLKGHTDRAWHVAWSPCGKFLASCGGDKSVRIWTRENVEENGEWVCAHVLEDAHTRTVRHVAWSHDGRFLASASFDATTCVWEKVGKDWELAATLEGHENEVKCVDWSRNSRQLVTCSRDKSVWIWEDEGECDFDCMSVLQEHTQDVKCVKFHPQTAIIGSASYDDTIKLYGDEEDDWEVFDTLKGHTSTVWCLDFDRNGERMVTSGDDKTIKIWQAYHPGNMQGIETPDHSHPKYVCVATLENIHTRPIFHCGFSKGGEGKERIASVAGDDSLVILKEAADSDPNAPKWAIQHREAKAHTQDVNCATWHPTNPCLLATAGDDLTVKIWQVPDM